MAEIVTNIADELMASMQQAVEIMDGRMVPGRVWSPRLLCRFLKFAAG